MKLGVIADDFTGATDIASLLTEGGMSTLQFGGVPSSLPTYPHHLQTVSSAKALVVSLKTRSVSPSQAIKQTLEALAWLKEQKCTHFYFKYASTFDSTAIGNIGPVTDALLTAVKQDFTIISPALPINKRTVYNGYLFIGEVLLAESGMKNHPINPMKDSAVHRLMQEQATGRCGVVPLPVIEQGAEAVRAALSHFKMNGYRYAVLDAATNSHLDIQAEAVHDMPFLTGASGLAGSLARHYTRTESRTAAQIPTHPERWSLNGGTVVLSGSCSEATNRQVSYYQKKASSYFIDISSCMQAPVLIDSYLDRLCDWYQLHRDEAYAPMLYATLPPEQLLIVEKKFGIEASRLAVENLLGKLALKLAALGVNNFIVAGGETSSIVVKTLNADMFEIGPAVSPGVPWIRALGHSLSFLLKSGNFGDDNFFARAQIQYRNAIKLPIPTVLHTSRTNETSSPFSGETIPLSDSPHPISHLIRDQGVV